MSTQMVALPQKTSMRFGRSMTPPDAYLLDSAFLVRIRKDLTSRWPKLWYLTELGHIFLDDF